MASKIDDNLSKRDKMIRDYLLRLIANKNKKLSGVFNRASQEDKYDGFKDIINHFVGGMYSYTYNTTLSDIYDDINYNHKGYSPYQYFDIDTLYAYYKFLDQIIDEIDAEQIKRRAYKPDSRMCSQSISRIAERLARSSSGDKEFGYYNHSKPIGVIKVNGDYRPRKPLTKEDFDNKYNYYECEMSLKQYLDERHPVRRTTASESSFEQLKTHAQQTFDFSGRSADNFGEDTVVRDAYGSQSNEESYDSHETMTYNVAPNLSIKLSIVKKELYLDAEYRPVTCITARGEEGMLYTTRDSAGRVYVGPLYNMDYEYIEDCDGEIFYPSKTLESVIKGVKQSGKTSGVGSKRSLVSSKNNDNSDQLTLMECCGLEDDGDDPIGD